MHSVLTPLVFGLENATLTTYVGAVGGVVTAIGIVIVCWIALAPLASSDAAEQFGVDDVASSGPDPVEVLEGRPEPVPASGDDPAIEPEARADDGTTERDVPTPAAAE